MFNCSCLCFFSTYNKEKYTKIIAILHSIARSSLGKLRNNLSLLWQFSWSESVRPNSDAKFLVNVTVYSFWKTNLLWQFSWFKNIAHERCYIYIVRGRPFNFWGGGGDFQKTFPARLSQKDPGYEDGLFWAKKIPALINWGKKYPAPLFGGKKMLQNSMVAGINLTSPRRSAGLIFRD